ncbi:hypothetical protein DXC09_02285 [Streptococcus vestibularis]|nr:hypothetical protein DXC09_02285 [Streptococcus vestibularis]
MSIDSMTVEVKVNVTNMEKFNDLVKGFNKKAHEFVPYRTFCSKLSVRAHLGIHLSILLYHLNRL